MKLEEIPLLRRSSEAAENTLLVLKIVRWGIWVKYLNYEVGKMFRLLTSNLVSMADILPYCWSQ